MKKNLTLIAHENSNYLYSSKGIESYECLFKEISKKAREKNLVKDTYCKALLKRELTYPTGIQASHGIAIPHTDSVHSNTNGLITVICDSPLNFKMMGNPEQNVKVDVVFFVLSNEGDNHLQQLSNLMDLIQNEKFLDELINNRDVNILRQLMNVC